MWRNIYLVKQGFGWNTRISWNFEVCYDLSLYLKQLWFFFTQSIVVLQYCGTLMCPLFEVPHRTSTAQLAGSVSCIRNLGKWLGRKMCIQTRCGYTLEIFRMCLTRIFSASRPWLSDICWFQPLIFRELNRLTLQLKGTSPSPNSEFRWIQKHRQSSCRCFKGQQDCDDLLVG